ncbi:hypothetical protein AB3X52_01805 [Nocardioides sp. DS6]|uniref:DUF3558 domain-containing protein n=1 Tax=Nocardioides eburneus TaxID=3231482 RepID=A0ABV3STR5_9ACTN
MRLRMFVATAFAVPLLAACGGGSDAGHAHSSHAATPLAASSAPASSAPPTFTGPVIKGASYALVLPASSKPFNGITDWSKGFEHGWNLTGYLSEAPCDCKETNDAQGLNDLVKERTRHDQRDYTRIQRGEDVTLDGYRFAHVAGSGGPSGQEYIDDYVTYYAGRSLDFQFVISGNAARYAKIEAQVAQILATLQLKG